LIKSLLKNNFHQLSSTYTLVNITQNGVFFHSSDARDDKRLLEEELFGASDVDGDGLLNLTEFNE